MDDTPEGLPADIEADYRVSDEVVASIAGMAAGQVPGVTAMGGGPGLGDVLGKRHFTRGVRVELGSREVAVDLYLHVGFGVRIPTVAQRVQERVKRAVEGMTGLQVVEVNVHVQGLDTGPPRPLAGAASGSEIPGHAVTVPDPDALPGPAQRDPAPLE